jgi:hypothetical protein
VSESIGEGRREAEKPQSETGGDHTLNNTLLQHYLVARLYLSLFLADLFQVIINECL